VYSPQTLPSGAFHGMVVRALLGDGPAGLALEQPLAPRQVIITGERAGAVSEHEYLAKTGLRRHGVDDLERAIDGLHGPVYVHIDLDVLEPTVFGSTCYPEPDGVQPQRLIDLVCQIDDIIGAAITEHAPSSDDVNGGEAELIRRLGAALAR
jgi:arginase